jgi:modification methylase
VTGRVNPPDAGGPAASRRPGGRRPASRRPAGCRPAGGHAAGDRATGGRLGSHPAQPPLRPTEIGGLAVPGMSVWATGQRSPRAQRSGRYLRESARHPARMLPAIAAYAIRRYSKVGELVADPMCGSGTTLVEAVHAGRDALGVEYEPTWARLATANLTHAATQGATGSGRVITGDARALPDLIPADAAGRVALVVTSPPYGSSVHGHVTRASGRVVKTHFTYGTDRANLARRTTEELLEGFAAILTGCRRLLRPGGVVVVTARPFRRGGVLVDLPAQILDAGRRAGLIPVERCVALLAALQDDGATSEGVRVLARPSFFQLQQVRKARTAGVPLHLIVHEDVLVFVAPDAGSAVPRTSSPPQGRHSLRRGARRQPALAAAGR